MCAFENTIQQALAKSARDRIATTQIIVDVARQHEDRQMQNAIDTQKKSKAVAAMALKRGVDMIEENRRARAERYGRAAAADASPLAESSPSATPMMSSSLPQAAPNRSALPASSSVTAPLRSFPAASPLSASQGNSSDSVSSIHVVDASSLIRVRLSTGTTRIIKCIPSGILLV